MPILWFGLPWTSLSGSGRSKYGCRCLGAPIRILRHFSAWSQSKMAKTSRMKRQTHFQRQFYDLGIPGRHYLAQVAQNMIVGVMVPRSGFCDTSQHKVMSKMAPDVQNEAIKPLSAPILWFGLSWTSLSGTVRPKYDCRCSGAPIRNLRHFSA